jgi:hypothetical protein
MTVVFGHHSRIYQNNNIIPMKFFHPILLVFLLQQVSFIDSLRCALQCSFVAFPLNVTLPTGACKHEERDDAQCTVTVEIDFKEGYISGELNIGRRTGIASLRTETKFQLETNSVMVTVWYTCTMSDNCDFDFLNELMTNKMAELNATYIQQKLINLLYTSTCNPADIQCTDSVCPSNRFCQAYLENVMMQQYNSTYINGSLPCADITPTGGLLKITQSFLPFASQAAEMFIRCNQKECNNNKTILEAYALIRNEFTLPINYSILNINSTFPTTTLPSVASFLALTYQLIFFSFLFSYV